MCLDSLPIDCSPIRHLPHTHKLVFDENVYSKEVSKLAFYNRVAEVSNIALLL